jgi:hypothetical protein
VNTRCQLRSSSSIAHEPFSCPSEAWFWFMACHQAKVDGARVAAGRGRVGRPCEPGDIHHLVTRLHGTGRLRPQHLRILIRYGLMMLPPDPSQLDRQADCQIWDQAMDCLEGPLRAKGIIA